MALEIKQSEGRLLLRLRVKPGARQACIKGEHGGALKLSVREAPEGGKANEAVINLLAKTLDIHTDQIQLVAGHTSQDKRVAITGIDEATLREKACHH